MHCRPLPFERVSSSQRMAWIQADLGEKNVHDSIAATISTPLGGLILAAGIAHHAAISDNFDPDQDWLDVHLELDLAAPLRLLRALLRANKIATGASIVFISSNLARHGLSGKVYYSAAKSGIEGATRSLARELGPQNIRVNAIAPGLLRTEMTADLGQNGYHAYAQSVPLGRVGEASDVAPLALFLLSSHSSYLTGQVIDVDGGWGA
jgi:3-oxoacyl-[acyl-carrier protein] reductase